MHAKCDIGVLDPLYVTRTLYTRWSKNGTLFVRRFFVCCYYIKCSMCPHSCWMTHS